MPSLIWINVEYVYKLRRPQSKEENIADVRDARTIIDEEKAGGEGWNAGVAQRGVEPIHVSAMNGKEEKNAWKHMVNDGFSIKQDMPANSHIFLYPDLTCVHLLGFISWITDLAHAHLHKPFPVKYV
jgi:hypothetical protein